mgnify:FL=1
MRDDVQEKVSKLWEQASTETLPTIGDLAGYRLDFLQLFGFDVPNVDYLADVNEIIPIKSII